MLNLCVGTGLEVDNERTASIASGKEEVCMDYLTTCREMKEFVSFDDTDVANLVALQPIVEKHGPTITEEFYGALGRVPTTRSFIEGKVDRLKGTHLQWMRTLVGGEYGDAYFESRWRIGMVHVRIGLDPFWPEIVMNVIRREILAAIAAEHADPVRVVELAGSFLKMCDLDLLVINLSYAEERVRRVTELTGIKRALLENIIRAAS